MSVEYFEPSDRYNPTLLLATINKAGSGGKVIIPNPGTYYTNGWSVAGAKIEGVGSDSVFLQLVDSNPLQFTAGARSTAKGFTIIPNSTSTVGLSVSSFRGIYEDIAVQGSAGNASFAGVELVDSANAGCYYNRLSSLYSTNCGGPNYLLHTVSHVSGTPYVNNNTFVSPISQASSTAAYQFNLAQGNTFIGGDGESSPIAFNLVAKADYTRVFGTWLENDSGGVALNIQASMVGIIFMPIYASSLTVSGLSNIPAASGSIIWQPGNANIVS